MLQRKRRLGFGFCFCASDHFETSENVLCASAFVSVSHFCFSLGSDGAGDRFDAALVKNGWFLVDVLKTEMCFVSLKKKIIQFR